MARIALNPMLRSVAGALTSVRPREHRTVMTEREAKTRFAELLLRHRDYTRAAAVQHGALMGQTEAQQLDTMAQHSPADPFVLDEERRFVEELGEEAFLPGKAEAA